MIGQCAAVALLLGALIETGCTADGARRAADGRGLLLRIQPATLRADGSSAALVEALDARTRQPVESARFRIRKGAALARMDGSWVRAGVNPGEITVSANAAGYTPATADVALLPDYADADGDGIPDSLRLSDESDRRAFTDWFTLLAESVYVLPENRRPKEVTDCAALLRFAYREALREHTGEWAAGLGLPRVSTAGSVARYDYPFTPLGANLFRVRAGPFLAADLGDGAFAQFANARSLMRWNTFPVTRDVHRAQPGDLLFFRQLQQNMPFHAMVFLGKSRFEPSAETYVVYHTGPIDGGAGEVRRPALEELLHHPSPRWRPTPGNPNFLGVFRWKILRESNP